jgi:hypothetical protein
MKRKEQALLAAAELQKLEEEKRVLTDQVDKLHKDISLIKKNAAKELQAAVAAAQHRAMVADRKAQATLHLRVRKATEEARAEREAALRVQRESFDEERDQIVARLDRKLDAKVVELNKCLEKVEIESTRAAALEEKIGEVQTQRGVVVQAVDGAQRGVECKSQRAKEQTLPEQALHMPRRNVVEPLEVTVGDPQTEVAHVAQSPFVAQTQLDANLMEQSKEEIAARREYAEDEESAVDGATAMVVQQQQTATMDLKGSEPQTKRTWLWCEILIFAAAGVGTAGVGIRRWFESHVQYFADRGNDPPPWGAVCRDNVRGKWKALGPNIPGQRDRRYLGRYTSLRRAVAWVLIFRANHAAVRLKVILQSVVGI